MQQAIVYTHQAYQRHEVPIGAVVVNDQGDQPKVKFLKRNEVSAINTFKWPDKDDIDFVQRESVVMKLAQPQTDRRGLLSFPRNNLKNFNIQ